MKEYQEVTSIWPRQCVCGVLVLTSKEDYWHGYHHGVVDKSVNTLSVNIPLVNTVVNTLGVVAWIGDASVNTPVNKRKAYRKEWMRKHRSK